MGATGAGMDSESGSSSLQNRAFRSGKLQTWRLGNAHPWGDFKASSVEGHSWDGASPGLSSVGWI